MTDKQQVSTINIVKYLGAIVAFCIGSGFATGQEVMQFFTSYGAGGIVGGVVSLIVYLLMCSAFMYVGKTTKLERPHDVFKFYCGDFVGTVFQWVAVAALYCVYIIMVSGAGAVFSDYYGLPAMYGQGLMVVCTILAVIVGFRKLVNILGLLGPIIVIGCLAVAIAAIFAAKDGFSGGLAYIAQADMLQASSTWWISAIIYPGFMTFLLATFVYELGTTANSEKEALGGGLAGAGAFSIAVLLIMVAQICNASIVDGTEIPTLHLASNLIPAIASIFAIIIFLGIFTTAAPLLWSTASRFADDSTMKFKLITVGLAIAAMFVVSFLPFSALVNLVYSTQGYLGLIMFIFMIVKHVQLRAKKGKKEAVATTVTE